MRIGRNWVTPFALGAFAVSAVTGVLLFFHLDTGLNKWAHEWLSWVLLIGIVLHGAANFQSLKKHFTQKTGLTIIAIFVLALGLSFLNIGKGGGKPPFVKPMRALANVPLEQVAIVAKTSPDTLLVRLTRAGYKVTSTQQKVSDIVGNDLGQQMQALNTIFGEMQ